MIVLPIGLRFHFCHETLFPYYNQDSTSSEMAPIVTMRPMEAMGDSDGDDTECTSDPKKPFIARIFSND